MLKPELLAPAGSLEKLKVAVLYGADAVYFSGTKYGLRARADNLTNDEISEGVKFAKRHGVKAYVTLNAFLHDEDFSGLEEFCQYIESVGVAAVIASDLGVIDVVQKSSGLKVHLSTQASCLNSNAALFWKAQGVERIVLGREVSIKEAAEIKELSGMEMEMFIHGAMCMSYSGNCVISNYTAGRDSNRGGCIQSCRFKYQQSVPGQNCSSESHFMSSKDMSGLNHLDAFIREGIDSLKIEGRMKSVFYVSTLCRVYRQAIDLYLSEGQISAQHERLEAELNSIPHRDYFGASFSEPAGALSVYQESAGTIRSGTHQFAGMVLDKDDKFAVVRLYAPILAEQNIEFLPFHGDPVSVSGSNIYELSGNKLVSPRQDCVVCIPVPDLLGLVEPFNIVRVSKA